MIAFFLGNWQRFAVYAGVAAVLLGAAWFHGYTRGEIKLFEYQAAEARAAVKIVVKQGAATERVVTKYIKVKEATQTIANGIRNEVIRYVETNPGYCLDVAWGRLHDAAAANTLPGTAAGSDGAERAPTAAGALDTVTENYAACHRTADKLDGLQAWVRAQQAVK